MNVAFAILIFLHGAIHLIGFAHWYRLAPRPQLEGRTLLPLSSAAPFFGTLWLATFVLLAIAAGLLLLSHGDHWWWPAVAGIALSQCLIIVAWPAAKFGTLANVAIGAGLFLSAAHTRFSNAIDGEAKAILERAPAIKGDVVSESDLARLPVPIRRWLLASGTVGRERARTVRLQQRGELRSGVNQRWMPARAEQYFTVDPPAFVWRVDTTMLHILPITGRDRFSEGEGNLLIKAGSVVDVANASDDKIALGAMLRFLGEMVWFPSAVLSEYVTWEAVDDARALATMRYKGRTVTAEFEINPQGRVTQLKAERYLGGGPDAKLTPWSIPCTEWRVVRGIEIPVRGNAIWRLPEGDFDYYRWEIVDVEIDRSELF